jgi:probable phosphoglycerate mutase
MMLSCLCSAVEVAAQVDKAAEKPVTIYVTRHGRTLGNIKEFVQGWMDAPLTPEGIEVAEDLGRGLRDVSFDYVVSSDLVRARQTVRLVMAQNRVSKDYRLEDSEMLREACFGSFEGESWNTMLKALAITDAEWGHSSVLFKIADTVKRLDTSGMAEDAAAIKSRMQAKLREVVEAQSRKGGGNVLLVAHGESISIMLSDLDPDFSYTDKFLDNAAVCKVLYEGGKFTIQSFNDTGYIKAGKALR